jgi:hypothetical protein
VTYRVAHDICLTELPTADDGALFLDQRAMMIAAHGRRAAAYWFAPADAEDDILRLGLDFESNRAALRWLPDDTHGVELEPDDPIVVMECSDCPVVTIPDELAVVSVETAKRAVVEYLSTGQRPTCVSWLSDPSGSPSAEHP